MSRIFDTCPATGSQLNTLPVGHPDPKEGQVCPVTNATTDHHKSIQKHPDVLSSATQADCPVLSAASQAKVCPVVGSSTTVLPPGHPQPSVGEVCPATKASSASHASILSEHPAVNVGATAKDCPVLTKQATASSSSQPDVCPVTSAKVHSLPPDHPTMSKLADGAICPVTKATTVHHVGIIHDHPPVTNGATAKDCPALQEAACPVIGPTATKAALPPNHPAADSGVCPVTGASAEHHDKVGSHPAINSASSEAVCPVVGAVAAHHKSIDAPAVSAPIAQCPVTGQYADGTRPAVQLPSAIAAAPIKYTLYGLPFSTFTRTVAMALHELQIPFEQVKCKPHSDEILKLNPFGRLPVLTLSHSGKEMTMCESESILHYLDSGDDRILRFPAKDFVKNQKVAEWNSIIANYVFEAVEVGVVKPLLADKNADVSAGVEKMHKILAIIEERAHKPYLLGMPTTLPDLYLYPILADLKASPRGGELDKYEKLSSWTTRMSKRSTALATREGTLEAGASPPS